VAGTAALDDDVRGGADAAAAGSAGPHGRSWNCIDPSGCGHRWISAAATAPLPIASASAQSDALPAAAAIRDALTLRGARSGRINALTPERSEDRFSGNYLARHGGRVPGRAIPGTVSRP
jgi:hypothetical protein